MIAKTIPEEPNDSVDLIVSLLVRHPELSRVVIKPRFAAIAFFFIVRGALGRRERTAFQRSVLAHLEAFRSLARVPASATAIRIRAVEGHTFVEIERSTKDLSRDEIALVVGLVAQSFGDQLIVNPPADESADEEGGRDDAVGSALDAVRRGKHRKGLVGFREERRVLIYFGRPS